MIIVVLSIFLLHLPERTNVLGQSTSEELVLLPKKPQYKAASKLGCAIGDTASAKAARVALLIAISAEVWSYPTYIEKLRKHDATWFGSISKDVAAGFGLRALYLACLDKPKLKYAEELEEYIAANIRPMK